MSASTISALVIGASRGLGLELARGIASSRKYNTVFATARKAQNEEIKGVKWISGVDVGEPNVGEVIVKALGGNKLGLVIYNAGYFTTETLDEPNWDEQLNMYKTCAMGPVFVTSKLKTSGSFANPSKLFFVTTEGGSIALRTKEEGGGNFGHHGSKAASNMAGKLIANELQEFGVTTVMIHPGFMQTEMTKNVGFDKFWDDGGAVPPSEAASSLLSFTDAVSSKHNAQFWAPRGPGDIGEAEKVMGKNLPTPLQLPW